MPIEKITCVQFDGEFPDFCYRLIMPDYGMPLIGTMLAHAGYDVRIYLEHIQPAELARRHASSTATTSSWARVMRPSSSSSTRWPEGVTSRRWRASRTATAIASGERARVPARRSSTSFRTST